MANNTELNIVIKAQDQASKAFDAVDGKLGGLGANLKKFGLAAGAAVAAAGVAVGAFALSSIKDFSTVGDEVEKMSKRTGLGAEAISGLRVAASMGGTSIEALEKGIRTMQRNMNDATGDTNRLSKEFADLGVTLDQGIFKLSPEEQFQALGNSIANIEDPGKRATAAMKAFGISGTDLLPMFEGGKFSMQEWEDEAGRLGVKFDDLSAKKAAELNDAMGRLTTAFQGLKLQIGGALAPVVTDLIENKLVPLARVVFDELSPYLKDLWENFQPLMPTIEKLAYIVGAVLIVALKILITVLSDIFKVLGYVIDKATAWGKVIWDVVGPAVNAMVSWLKILLGPIQQTIDRLQQLKDMAVAAFEAAKKVAGGVIGAVSNAVNTVGSTVGSIFGRASGGPVSAGSPYIVGEQGPELFVPSSNGTIVPNGAGTSVTVNIGNLWGANPETAAREIGNLIIDRLAANARI